MAGPRPPGPSRRAVGASRRARVPVEVRHPPAPFVPARRFEERRRPRAASPSSAEPSDPSGRRAVHPRRQPVGRWPRRRVPADAGSTMLLAVFTLSALAVVGAVGWLGARQPADPGRRGRAVGRAGRTCLVRLLAMMPEHPRTCGTRTPPGCAGHRRGRAAGAARHPQRHRAAGAARRTQTAPSAASSGAIVDNDGVTACRYLTTPRAREYAKGECQGYFGDAQLRAGGRCEQRRQLDQLRYARTAGRDRLGAPLRARARHAGRALGVPRAADLARGGGVRPLT